MKKFTQITIASFALSQASGAQAMPCCCGKPDQESPANEQVDQDSPTEVRADDTEPASTPKQPASTPEQPATTPKQPATTPEQPATTPKQPATTPETPKQEDPNSVADLPLTKDFTDTTTTTTGEAAGETTSIANPTSAASTPETNTEATAEKGLRANMMKQLKKVMEFKNSLRGSSGNGKGCLSGLMSKKAVAVGTVLLSVVYTCLPGSGAPVSDAGQAEAKLRSVYENVSQKQLVHIPDVHQACDVGQCPTSDFETELLGRYVDLYGEKKEMDVLKKEIEVEEPSTKEKCGWSLKRFIPGTECNKEVAALDTKKDTVQSWQGKWDAVPQAKKGVAQATLENRERQQRLQEKQQRFEDCTYRTRKDAQIKRNEMRKAAGKPTLNWSQDFDALAVDNGRSVDNLSRELCSSDKKNWDEITDKLAHHMGERDNMATLKKEIEKADKVIANKPFWNNERACNEYIASPLEKQSEGEGLIAETAKKAKKWFATGHCKKPFEFRDLRQAAAAKVDACESRGHCGVAGVKFL